MPSLSTIITKVFKSKALILGWLTFIVGLLSYLVSDQWIANYPEVVAILVSVLGALQVVVRWLTVLPLSDK